MANPIKVTGSMIKECVGEFEKYLRDAILKNGEIKFEKKYKWKDGTRATVLISPTAHTKMQKLVHGFDTEVAWHGTVTRIDDNTWRIEDILVYPQKVTGGTVVVDEPYAKWVVQLDSDIVNSMRMQGHSHVDFATTPSSTDITAQKEQLDYIPNDSYYIFMILNKKRSMYISLYDFKTNTRYDTADIDVRIEGDNTEDDFVAKAKKMATAEVKKSPISYTSGYNYGAGFLNSTYGTNKYSTK